ncbi:helix-turn-helix domain-containing protein [Sneathiella sp. P13V-1]|uniref:helix-turn-helix domain-containing protein n=1 Tax=Sneathiella sp. P13V-1 TaxID=2697366 RepID=UPI00187B5D34|nr:helix-turn-helix transcriptional regulator [Sneathiella sp. P13V-1]MBE7635942.1 helix-turn-helix domain-containing protein [Sneathiella sp. P13V-1]
MSYDKEYWAQEIGRRFRTVRDREGLSLEQLSLLSGATIANLSKIERGKANITLATMVSLCEALGIKLPELFIGGDEQSGALAQKGETADREPQEDGYSLGEDE